MTEWQLKTPVALIIFKRPDVTEKVFEVIRQAKPPKLFVIADSPRANRPDETEKCAATRAIINRVDWDCEVLKNYSDTNLGCGVRIFTGLSWVFEQVEEAIILEDDCLPHLTFFRFCEELLEKYRYHNQITQVDGSNLRFRKRRSDYSYYFSRYGHCWGWASWRRAWQLYDFKIKDFCEIEAWLYDFLKDRKIAQYWIQNFKNFNVVSDPSQLSVWSYQWQLSCWLRGGLSIQPNVNLVSNIGFGTVATNTSDSGSEFANVPVKEILFPLKHPKVITRDVRADALIETKMLRERHPSLMFRIRRKVSKILKTKKLFINRN